VPESSSSCTLIFLVSQSEKRVCQERVSFSNVQRTQQALGAAQHEGCVRTCLSCTGAPCGPRPEAGCAQPVK